ncbi:IclR family transcriptional regulator [Azospirillum endophyticum]
MTNSDDRATVKSADRVLTLLELLGRWDREMSHTEIADAMGIPKSSLTQLLRTLVAREYLAYSPVTKGYRLGRAIRRLADRNSQSYDLVEVVKPLLEEITAATSESSALNILSGDEAKVVAAVNSPMRLLSHMRLGDLAPLYATSGGKVILAFLPTDMQEEYLKRVELVPVTHKTIRSIADLRAQLQTIRRENLAYSFEEFTEGIIGMACPILDDQGAVLGSINVAMPAVRYSSAARDRIAGVLERAAGALTQQLRRVRMEVPA